MTKYLVPLSLFLSLFLSHSVAFAIGVVDFNPTSHWTCDETSGVRYDSNTTTANDLTDNNTVGYGTGLLNNACDFESTNSEYLSIDDNVSLEPTSLTFSAWANRESNTFYIGGKAYSTSHTAPYSSYLLGWGGDSPYPSYSYLGGGSNSALVDGLAIANSVWHHYVLTYDGSVHRLYLDGVEVENASFLSGISYSTGGFKIGCVPSYCNAGYFYDGLVDEISLFDYTMTSGEVSTLYNGGTPLYYESVATTSTSTVDLTNVENSLQLLSDAFIFWGGLFLLALAFLVWYKLIKPLI